MLLFLIPADSPDITAEYKILLQELRQYKAELMDKQKMLAVTKADLLDEQQEKALRRRIPRSLPVMLISSVTGRNITQLKEQIWNTLWNQ
jgi:GTP-binding protein